MSLITPITVLYDISIWTDAELRFVFDSLFNYPFFVWLLRESNKKWWCHIKNWEINEPFMFQASIFFGFDCFATVSYVFGSKRFHFATCIVIFFVFWIDAYPDLKGFYMGRGSFFKPPPSIWPLKRRYSSIISLILPIKLGKIY